MDSEKKQRVQKKEQIGTNLTSELLPMEHTKQKDNKPVTIMKPTACAFVEDLGEKILKFVDDNDK